MPDELSKKNNNFYLIIAIFATVTLFISGGVMYFFSNKFDKQKFECDTIIKKNEDLIQRENISCEGRVWSCQKNISELERRVRESDSLCAKDIEDEIKGRERLSCIIVGGTCEEDSQKTKDYIDKIIKENQYTIINECLYKGGKRALDGNLYSYASTDFYGKKINCEECGRGIGEGIDEWFRFREGNKLYIFLYGAAGCGGCVFNGPYLIIDLDSDKIEGRNATLPFLPNLILLKDSRYGIEASWVAWQAEKIDLYLYDFVQAKRLKLLYTVPQDKTIIIEGDGEHLIRL
ncbi:hypothetical protein GYA13_04925 [Candidatus Kuenenbacteria bacterium]|nr:hypothetical protein [Candidatus Kuenenbacteria bacterium]